MAPGSGAADIWPITQQKQLFSIFDNVEDLIGVKLTDKYLMLPIKSVSGIFFQTETTFETCQLCLRESCIRRRSPYDADLDRKYREEV